MLVVFVIEFVLVDVVVAVAGAVVVAVVDVLVVVWSLVLLVGCWAFWFGVCCRVLVVVLLDLFVLVCCLLRVGC